MGGLTVALLRGRLLHDGHEVVLQVRVEELSVAVYKVQRILLLGALLYGYPEQGKYDVDLVLLCDGLHIMDKRIGRGFRAPKRIFGKHQQGRIVLRGLFGACADYVLECLEQLLLI